MATPEYVARLRRRPEILTDGFPRRRPKWIEWVTTTDHKKIGILYLFTCAFFFLVGGVEALLMRIQLGAPDNTFLDPTTYNQLFTLHGTTMVFMVVVPIAAAFGNYMVPLMIGARDMAFPRLNMLSWWLLVAGGVVLYATLFFTVPEAGWTSYAPLSSDTFLPSHGIDAWILALHLVGLSSILGSINFIATIHNMRAPGMSWSRLPLFCWTILVYSYLIVIVIASFTATLAMLLIDRNFNGTFFNADAGGSALLWQHLFWFMGHPEVYIMALPGFGMVSEIIPVFARKPIFGYKAMVTSIGAIAFLSVLVWAHHMFSTPIGIGVLGYFMIASLLIAIPTGIKIFNWLATLWRGNIEFTIPLLFCVGMIAQFVVGGATGVMLAVFPLDWQLTDTYFVVAHMHHVLFGGIFFAIVGAFYYWFPKMTGRFMSDTWGKVSFWTMLVGFNVTFIPLYSAGLSGMPRRVVEYSASSGLHDYNLASTIGSFLLGLSTLITVVNAIWSLRNGRKAGPDPWRANTLEWFTTSPPPQHNFDVIPIVRSAEPMKDFRRRARQLEAEIDATPPPVKEPVP
ncbi:MAG: cytochrome c oxidase subunit I [Solirubrobacterales bacterium]